MKSLLIRVDAFPGSHISDAAKDAISLAKQFDCGVILSFNGHDLTILGHYSPDQVEEQYDELIQAI